MKRALLIGVLLFLCGVVLFAQEHPSPPKPTPGPAAPSEEKRQSSPIEILSDTFGVDLNPYLQGVVVPTVRNNWYNLIPEKARAPIMKKGKVLINFAIRKDGSVAGISFASTSGDVALDRAAYGGISASNPFPPLPDEFKGTYIALRFHFYYNFSGSEIEAESKKPARKSAVGVSISPDSTIEVPVGRSQVVTATVTGTTNTSLKWSVSGSGCSGAACGSINNGLYAAPSAPPTPPSVTLTAISEEDPTASASLVIQIVQSKETR